VEGSNIRTSLIDCPAEAVNLLADIPADMSCAGMMEVK